MIGGHLMVINTLPSAGAPLKVVSNNIAGGVGGAIYTFSSSSVTVDCIIMIKNWMLFPSQAGVVNNVYVQYPVPPGLSPSPLVTRHL
jgi:hypothetical protein